MATVNVQANGQAQKGLSLGTSVKTAGGTYKITGVKADGSYTSVKVPSASSSPSSPSSYSSGSSSPFGSALSGATSAATNAVNAVKANGGSTSSGGVFTPATYQAHLNNFFGGDAQKYADEIKKNEASGTLSDPTAANAFKQAYPNLFTTAAPVVAPAAAPAATLPADTNTNPYKIGLRSFLENLGQAVNWDPTSKNISTSSGLNFTPSSYTLEGDTAYADPLTLAGAFLGQKPKELTPDLYNQYANTAETMLEPQRQARLNALQQVLNERQKTTRQAAISRGTYQSPTYNDNIQTTVENPYAADVSALESQMATLVNTNAMDQYNQQKTAEQALTDKIVSYLTGMSDVGRQEDWQRTLQALALGSGGMLNG